MRKFKFLTLLLLLPAVIDAQTTNDMDPVEAGESDTVQIEYEELDWNCLCIPKNRYVIIKSYYDLNYFYNNGFYPGCQQIDTTMFDFNKEVIIGFHTSVGGCPGLRNRIKVTIIRIDSEQKYIFNIPNRIGSCKALFPYFKLLRFPIEHKDYMIEFQDRKFPLTQTRLNCKETHEKILNDR